MSSDLSVLRVNQEGYAAGLPVIAAVLGNEPVTLKNASGETLQTIVPDTPQPDPASGDAVTLLYLGVLPEGAYDLECGACRRRLTVSPAAWNTVTHAMIKGLYYQRCGCGLHAKHAGVWVHPPCHTAPALEWEDRSVSRRITGGWHDAGDYGKYVAPGAVTVAHLLCAWKLFPQGCGDDLNIPETNASNANTFVVIIANEDYKSVASVPFALNDGRILAKYCQRTLGIPATNIKVYENATYNDMRLSIAWLKNVCEKYEGEASVIFYYAGHGIPDASDKSSYLLPVDGDGRYVATGYKLDELYQKLGAMPTKSTTILLDACFSGTNRDGKMLSSARGVALKVKSGVPQGNTVVLSAAQGDETALPNEEEGHGLFTYYILKKLQETNGDVTLQDLSQYVIREVGRKSAVTNKPQTPCVTPSVTLGDQWQNWKLK